MDQESFYLLNRAYNKRRGRTDVDYGVVPADVSAATERLVKAGTINVNGEITAKGIEKLAPYKVDNAVILAAGAATRFVPLSLEKPKGLFEISGEPLIERQIKQLRAAGITDITLVLGYKKEMFFYLKDKYHVKFIFNDEYNTKNNTYSVYLAKDELKNTYVCSSDDYFVQNPFQSYEYQSFYAGYHTVQKTNEMYVKIDPASRITAMVKGLRAGDILLGHSFWRAEFSHQIIDLLTQDQQVGVYDNMFWEWLVKDKLTQLPPLYFKRYSADEIFEFDYFAQLRDFDKEYVAGSHSRILAHIKDVFQCGEGDITNFRAIYEGMTNTSFVFHIHGEDYVYRYPGKGTDQIINRHNERHSQEIAKRLGIDPTFVYEDVNEGWKISKYVQHFREPDYSSPQDSAKVIQALQRLHQADVKVDYGLRPWEDACRMEDLLRHHGLVSLEQFAGLKKKVKQLYQQTQDDGIKECFCHGDTYKHNWMLKTDGQTILIDWEYSGMADPGVDVGYYIVDAMYDFDQARDFIKAYLADDDTPQNEFHFMAYTAIIAYYWFVWALYREAYGAAMGESLYNWYQIAEKYADYLLEG